MPKAYFNTYTTQSDLIALRNAYSHVYGNY